MCRPQEIGTRSARNTQPIPRAGHLSCASASTKAGHWLERPPSRPPGPRPQTTARVRGLGRASYVLPTNRLPPSGPTRRVRLPARRAFHLSACGDGRPVRPSRLPRCRRAIEWRPGVSPGHATIDVPTRSPGNGGFSGSSPRPKLGRSSCRYWMQIRGQRQPVGGDLNSYTSRQSINRNDINSTAGRTRGSGMAAQIRRNSASQVVEPSSNIRKTRVVRRLLLTEQFTLTEVLIDEETDDDT